MANNKNQQPHLLLHTYFRSSCSARVRTAAHLKSIPLEYSFIHLLKDDQSSPDYTATNPSASVPTLTVTPVSGEKIIIRQSVAILEFLEEYFPDRPNLLPSPDDPVTRAKVRELVNIVAMDIQPPTNLRVLKMVKTISHGSDTASAEWVRALASKGLEAYDKLAKIHAGSYSVGDEITMADVCLAPAVEGALRFGVDIKQFPTVEKIYNNIRILEAFTKGDWKHQEDTPEEFREAD